MTLKRERTQAAARSGRRRPASAPVAIVGRAAAFVYALADDASGSGTSRISRCSSVLALALLAVRCGIVIVQSSPLGRRSIGDARISSSSCSPWQPATLAVAASWGDNRYIHDDWPAISIGHPPPGAVAVPAEPGDCRCGQPRGDLSRFPGSAASAARLLLTPRRSPFVISSVTPMLALCFGAAMFSASFISALERWQRRAELATRRITSQLRAGIVRSVQQDRVTILNAMCCPSSPTCCRAAR